MAQKDRFLTCCGLLELGQVLRCPIDLCFYDRAVQRGSTPNNQEQSKAKLREPKPESGN
jgi:hypothetical protein